MGQQWLPLSFVSFVIGKFQQIQVEKVKVVHWHTWYIGGVDSESRLRFLKFRPQNSFLGKFGPKNSKLSILSENWCTKCLKDIDSKSGLRFLKFQPQNLFLGKFGPKNSKLSILSENWYPLYLKDADSYSNISFLDFKS